MKIGMVSLGCPKNRVDSEIMLGLITERHMTITNDPSEAELIIVNTCGFIESAKEESINTILQMGNYKITGCCKYLIVAGCLVQRYAEELLENLPEVDAIIGTECYNEITNVIDRVQNKERFVLLEPNNSNNSTMRILTTPSYMAYLKIAEGCDNCCSYCIIPKLRGPYRSRQLEDVITEAKNLIANGVKEIIVVAQDTTRYGEDLKEQTLLLPELLRQLNALDGLHWIRVMYCYPNNFTDELIEAFATLEKVCKYVDIPLQHASDRLLSTMNRYDTKAEIEALLQKMRAKIPGLAIRTTFIVGFPGETEKDFEELKEFVVEQKFENAGVFMYSREEGTVAAEMPQQIPEEIKENRYHELMTIQAEISEEKHQSLEDTILEVIVEGQDTENPDLIYGRSYREAPEIDGSIFIENAGNLTAGDLVKVRISQGFTYEMVGERI